MHLDSPEFLINVKSLPDPESAEYTAFGKMRTKR